MEPPPRASTSLFQVYLRLKPPAKGLDQVNGFSQAQGVSERYLTVEQSRTDTDDKIPTHITITPPLESRRRAVEKFAFTRVFQEASEQLEIFKGSGIIPLIEGVLGADGKLGRDGLLATLGVTGSGKVRDTLFYRHWSADLRFNSLTDPNRVIPYSDHVRSAG
ncbi:MAG: hypothetical protein M1837_005965 [Sclerophora amabilis]|nr:MAG: hypothetical protein M1837_005965 [Sclerophora amabilis]